MSVCYNIIRARRRRSYRHASFASTNIALDRPTTSVTNLISPTHFIFGSNTDVGKTVLTAALIRASYERSNKSHYIKPLQCGGSDEAFVRKYAPSVSSTKNLFFWETPASPHLASRIEDEPISDENVLHSLNKHLRQLKTPSSPSSSSTTTNNIENPPSSCSSSRDSIWIETAGGVLSPSSSSRDNLCSHHARNNDGWGWTTQADLYKPFQNQSSVVLIGDGTLGGISTTISSLEALLNRKYTVKGILLIRDFDTNDTNKEALKEYVSRFVRLDRSQHQNYGGKLFENPEQSILSLPQLPPESDPLNEWFDSNDVKEPISSFVHDHLFSSDRQ